MSKVIDRETIAYYRCPEMYGTCHVDQFPDSRTGYFRFGHDAICYGQCSIGTSTVVLESTLYDASQAARAGNGYVSLPFSPSEVVGNLRLERYAAQFLEKNRQGLLWRVQREAYYSLRPLLGVSVRKHLQRRALRGWDEIPFPAWPVDRTVERVFERFMRLSMDAHGVDKVPFIWFWPHGAKSCTIMTHDVEEEGGARRCEALMDLDSSIGLMASFQLIPEGRYSVSKDFLAGIRTRGFEVNVHDFNHDGRLYDSRDIFLRRAEKINQYLVAYGARGFRSAVLYRKLDWYDAFEFAYDMSVPNVAHLDPQRGGCCTITPYFVGQSVELPLTTIQDYSLFNVLGQYSIELWKKQADYIVRNNGLLSFNIHPDYLADRTAVASYVALLELLAKLRADNYTYFAPPGDVERWWRERSQMNLVYEKGKWQIRGPGSERAVIAYARSDGDRLSYSFDCQMQTP